jgi:3-deoxy-D-manno-octulosonic-acid transferase
MLAPCEPEVPHAPSLQRAVHAAHTPAHAATAAALAARAPAYRERLAERLGYFEAPPGDSPVLWVHAVSLGETLAAAPLIERLLDALPDWRIAVTTTTPTGSAQVQRLFGDRVFHAYAPWDTPGAVRRTLRRLRPRVLLIMETELWPNLLHGCAASGCRVMLANARLSARSAAGYARLSGLTRGMLARIEQIAAQDEDDAQRFLALGADAGRVRVTGSIKYDLEISAARRAEVAALRAAWQLEKRRVLIVASTHEGEDELALQAFAALRGRVPDALLILAPRHPERFDSVAAKCRDAGWQVLRRSEAAAVTAATDLLLLDTVGELLSFYGLADLAVVGGSFVDNGGHNPLEPAAWGLPVLAGPSMFNFAAITARLARCGGLEQVSGAAALATRVVALLEDAAARQRLGAAARAEVERNRGALDRVVAAVLALT